jgi:hypothetical protein
MNLGSQHRSAALGAALVAGSLAALVLLGGCNEEAPPSLYNPTAPSGPQPVVTSVLPSDSLLATITMVTITGQNFSPDPTQDIVFFDATPAQIVSASATQLMVITPNLLSDSAKIRVSTRGSALFSDPPVVRRLLAAAVEFGKAKSDEDSYALAVDNQGNVYVSRTQTSNGANLGILKISPDGVRSDSVFSYSASVTKFSALKVGPDGFMYGVRGLNALYRIPMTGGAPVLWTDPTLNGLGKLNDIDFDQAGNIWGAGDGTKIYRVTSGGLVKGFPYTATIRTLRVFNNNLYVGGKTGTQEGVWSFPIISSDSLGSPTLVWDNSAYYAPLSPAVTAVTFSADGGMYVGVDAQDGILVVTGGVATPLYPGVILPTPQSFAWSLGTDLYYSRGGAVYPHRVIRVNTLRQGAPYYGRQ